LYLQEKKESKRMNEKSGAFTKRAYRESARIAKCSFLLLLFSRARASEERKKRAQETSLDFLSLRYKIYEPRSFFLLRSYNQKVW